MITLTLKHREKPLGSQITRIWRCFASARKEGIWSKYVKGFAAFLEVKFSDKTKCWHVHLHVIAEGSYIPQKELSHDWHVATGDSFIVDVQRKGTPESIARYAAKYASKPINAGDLESSGQFAAAINAVRKRRLWYIGGSWKGKLKLLEHGDDPGDWEYIESANALYSRAASGDQFALQIIAELTDRELHGPEP